MLKLLVAERFVSLVKNTILNFNLGCCLVFLSWVPVRLYFPRCTVPFSFSTRHHWRVYTINTFKFRRNVLTRLNNVLTHRLDSLSRIMEWHRSAPLFFYINICFSFSTLRLNITFYLRPGLIIKFCSYGCNLTWNLPFSGLLLYVIKRNSYEMITLFLMESFAPTTVGHRPIIFIALPWLWAFYFKDKTTRNWRVQRLLLRLGISHNQFLCKGATIP
jgi:hypothetical protein